MTTPEMMMTPSWFERELETEAIVEFESTLSPEEIEMYEQLAEEDFTHWMKSRGVEFPSEPF